ncbi:MAG: TatD family hydrolase [Holosporales bacterium]|jgi:TatD DNase family protein|nr:TatD family hydrolase [Holosporales bacterium]
MIVDSHCHLDSFYDLDSIIARAKNAGVTWMVTIGTEIDDFTRLKEICDSHIDCCSMTIGVHPDNIGLLQKEDFDNACIYIKDDHVIGIGEIGLDYKDNPDQENVHRQKAAFEYQLHLAETHGKPVYIHTRNAFEDTLSVVRNFPSVRGIFHCFCEGVDQARKALDMGYLISLSGIVTFKNAVSVHDVATYVPLDRLLVETDSPFLAPTPYRGKQNEPAYVKLVAERIAELRSVSPDVVFTQTTQNFINLFSNARSSLWMAHSALASPKDFDNSNASKY